MRVMGMKVEAVFTVWVVKCRFPNSGGSCTMEELWSRDYLGLVWTFSAVWWLSLLFFFTRLKDDDSGDHDQNEENNTQKDSEKEKNDREKPQSTTKRKVWCWHLQSTARAWCGSARESVLSSEMRKVCLGRAVVSVHCYCCSEDEGLCSILIIWCNFWRPLIWGVNAALTNIASTLLGFGMEMRNKALFFSKNKCGGGHGKRTPCLTGQ